MSDVLRVSDVGIITVRIDLRKLTRFILIGAIVLPPIYMLLMMKIGALRFPYWDHIETARLLIQFFDGTLNFQALTESQAQTVPVVPRLLFIGMAYLTNWDLRVEYIALLVTLAWSFAVVLFALHAISTAWPRLNRLAAAAIISILVCSPAGSMNHDWSLMLIATIAHACIVTSMVLLALRPASWGVNIAAAALAWLASLSMGQGLFVFPIAVMIHQLASDRLFVPNRKTIFWVINLAACFAVIVPRLPLGTEHATISHFIQFFFIYIGMPLGELIWFPVNGAIDLRETYWINLIVGFLIVVAAAITAWRALSSRRSATSLLFFSFAAFGIICAMVTAWGRAIGPLAIESANASRYSLFSACILFGLIFFYGGVLSVRRASGWCTAALACFLALSSLSYYRGMQPYVTCGAQNLWLAIAYSPDASQTEFDDRVYPDVDVFRQARSDLFRLRIGPYRTTRR